jgi:hypothetical protein
VTAVPNKQIRNNNDTSVNIKSESHKPELETRLNTKSPSKGLKRKGKQAAEHKDGTAPGISSAIDPKSASKNEAAQTSNAPKTSEEKGKKKDDAFKGRPTPSTTANPSANDLKAPSTQTDTKQEDKPPGEIGSSKRSKKNKTKRKSSATPTAPTTRSRMPTLSGPELPGLEAPSSSCAVPIAAKAPATSAWGANSPKSIREPAAAATKPQAPKMQKTENETTDVTKTSQVETKPENELERKGG